MAIEQKRFPFCSRSFYHEAAFLACGISGEGIIGGRIGGGFRGSGGGFGGGRFGGGGAGGKF